MLLGLVPVRILKAFYPDIYKRKTMKQLCKKSEVSREPVYRYLKNFEKNEYVIHKKIDSLNVFTLNLEHPHIRVLLGLFMRESLEEAKEAKEIKDIAESSAGLGTRQNVFAAILFYPKDKKKRRIIYVTPEKVAGDYREAVKLSSKHQGSVDSTFLTLEQFVESLKEEDNLKILMKQALVLFGYETVVESIVDSLE